MELYEVIHKNRCCKSYKPDMPEREILNRLVEAGLWAPSGLNIQGWDITVMTGKPRDDFIALVKQSLAGQGVNSKMVQPLEAAFLADLGGAPVVIAVTIFKYPDEKNNNTSLQSGAALMQNLVLAAQAEGLGICWISEIQDVEEKLLALLDKKDRKLLAITPVGYPAEEPVRLAPDKPQIRWVGFD